MRRLGLTAVAALVALGLAGAAEAQQKFRFAIVPKAMNNPYFDLSRDGCMKRAQELGNIECVYIGPVEHEPATQTQIIQDLISQRVDGIAIAVSDAAAAVRVIKQARDAGITVITFDADSPDSVRQAYVGTDNKAFGRELANQLKALRPQGGTYAMISGGPAAANLNERVLGVREGLQGSNWREVSGSPLFCNDDLALSVQQMSDIVTANPNIDAVLPVGGWPMFVPEAYKAFVQANRRNYDSGKLSLVVADTLRIQVELLKQGFANALVGQRPYEMGVKAMDLLLALKQGQSVPPVTYVGLDIVTRANADQFLK